MARRREGFSDAEQWLVIGVPVVALFGFIWLSGRNKQQAAPTKGLGGCNCHQGLGAPQQIYEWGRRGYPYAPYHPNSTHGDAPMLFGSYPVGVVVD
jgi:hypothetical protein